MPEQASARDQLPRRELRTEEVASVVSLLQPESPDVFVRALGGDPGQLASAIRGQLAEGARRLGHNPDHTRMWWYRCRRRSHPRIR